MSNLSKAASFDEAISAQIARRPLNVVASLVLYVDQDCFDNACSPSLQVLKLVHIFVAALLVVSGVGDIHHLVKQTLANTLLKITWMYI